MVSYLLLRQGFLNQLIRVIYFIPQQFLNTLLSEGDAYMHATTEAFIFKHFNLSSSLWNVYTEPLQGSVMKPYDDIPYGNF